MRFQTLMFSDGVEVQQARNEPDDGYRSYRIITVRGQEQEEPEKIEITAKRLAVSIADYVLVLTCLGVVGISRVRAAFAQALGIPEDEIRLIRKNSRNQVSDFIISGDVTEDQWRAALERVEFE